MVAVTDMQRPAEPVVTPLPAEIDMANAEDGGDQLRSALTPGVTIVIADMTSTVAGDGYPGPGMGGQLDAPSPPAAIDPLMTGISRDAPRYPPVLHRPDIDSAYGRPTQEARPDSQAAYHNEVIAMTAEREPVPARSGWALTALRRAIGVLHHLHKENLRASEAIFRPIGAPRPRPRADMPAGSAGPAASATERAERVS
jgi:hypothetical protein